MLDRLTDRDASDTAWPARCAGTKPPNSGVQARTYCLSAEFSDTLQTIFKVFDVFRCSERAVAWVLRLNLFGAAVDFGDQIYSRILKRRSCNWIRRRAWLKIKYQQTNTGHSLWAARWRPDSSGGRWKVEVGLITLGAKSPVARPVK